MFDPGSRYAALRSLVVRLPSGRGVTCIERRFLPRGEDLPAQGGVTPRPGERLDQIAARTLGDPLLFWRLCDASGTLNPFDDTALPARTLRVPRPRP